MSLKSETANTAWGDVHLYLGIPAAGQTMSTSLDDLGSIDDDGLSIETSDGTQYQLKDINGAILDELKLEPELTVNFTLVKPSEAVRAKFWDVEEGGEGNSRIIKVKSMVASNNYSLKFSNPRMVGSETFEAPYCSVNMKPIYSASKGFTAECSAKVIKGQAGYFFAFGTVAEA